MLNTTIYNFPTQSNDETAMLPEPDDELLIAYGKINYWWNEMFKFQRLGDLDNWRLAVRKWQQSQKDFKGVSKKFKNTEHYSMKERMKPMKEKTNV